MKEVNCSESKRANAGSARISDDNSDLIADNNKKNIREGIHGEDYLDKLPCNVPEGERGAYPEKRAGTWPVSYVDPETIDEDAD